MSALELPSELFAAAANRATELLAKSRKKSFEPPELPREATPDAFAEAIAWHRQKLALRKEDWEELSTRARKRAFTAAGVARLSVLDDVMKAIDSALTKGETLEDFKRRVTSKLEGEWGGEIPGRIENIFRTNVQHAYSHGRFNQLEDPDLIAARPFRKFVATLDLRTSEVCKACANVVLPADHPWWQSHLPPLHFQCRSTWVSLRTSQAEKSGVTMRLPTVQVQEGFGSTSAAEWEPDIAAKDRALVETYRRGR